MLDLERAWEWRLSSGVVRRLLGGTPEQLPDRYAAASPAARLPLGVPALLTHGGRGRHRPARDERGVPRRRARGGRRVRARRCCPTRTTSATSTRPTRCGRRWSSGSAEPRARARARRRRPAARRSATASSTPTRSRIYLDGNSLGRLPLATRDRLAAIVAEWGERLVTGWPEWIDAPARVGDLLAEHVLGARPGEVIVGRLDDGQPVQALLRRARHARGRDRHRPRQLPDRPLRARGARRAPRPRAAARRRRRRTRSPSAARRSWCSRTSTTARGELADIAALTAAHRAPTSSGTSRHSAGALPVELRARRRPARGRLHLQVPQRRARARRPSCTSPRSARRSCARRSGAGSASATSSRWSATTTRSTGSGASRPARRRSSRSPRSRRACG